MNMQLARESGCDDTRSRETYNSRLHYLEHVDEANEVLWIDLEIDGQSFRMDKGDVWDILCTAESVFDRMNDPV